MKIALLTQALGHNYGGVLQAFALKTVLERRGHSVILLDWYSLFPLRIRRKIMSSKIRRFVRKNFNIRYFTKHLWKPCAVRAVDAVVVGSDQVWRPRYNRKNMIFHNFLDFCQGKKLIRVAYAASFGTDQNEFTQSQIDRIRPLLAHFDGVSVREDSGVDLCGEIFGVAAEHLPDPTLLLDAEDYMAAAGISPDDKPSGGLLSYILDESEETKAFVERLAAERSLTAFRCNSQYENHDAPLKERIQPPLEDWLKAFRNADFVVADSFHAAVFSIIFNKPFVILANKYRGLARFNSLFKLFDCKENMILSVQEYDSSKSYLPNRAAVEEVIAAQRIKAKEYLDRFFPSTDGVKEDKNHYICR